jgi:Protein of unknown function (DUF1592)/Protein of unknown function (DUF1588)/Protein of unknown function (DUF1587)/Protein of unknown function (DUF1585)/Protein of unknown function (DUF1595)/Planctomycete cytochrome C
MAEVEQLDRRTLGAFLTLLACCVLPVGTQRAQVGGPASMSTDERALLDRYCVSCHSDRLKTGGLTLQSLDPAHVESAPEIWEKVVKKLRVSEMPPAGARRPEKAASDLMVARLEAALDRVAEGAPNPGRPPVHRLNRAEYTNAVRDLLAVDLDGQALLPADDVTEGFDNLAGGLTVSPLLMERYLAVAKRVSRLAVGDPTIRPSFEARVYQIPSLMMQDDRMDDELPFGSRGGIAIRHRFPLDGEYQIKVLLRRTMYSMIRGLLDPQQLEIRVDGVLAKALTVGGGDRGRPAPMSFEQAESSPEWREYLQDADAHLEAAVPVAAGSHVVGVSFVRRDWELESVMQAGETQFAFSGDASLSSPSGKRESAVDSVAISGPYHPTGSGDTTSRQRLFVCRPRTHVEEEPCAKRILSTVAQRAFRRPVNARDIQMLLPFYGAGRERSGFENGIQEALTRILVDPEFIFRIERAPAGVADTPSRLSDLELASRLSFFLWSTIPDDTLLTLAKQGKLSDPVVLEAQVRRMLTDDRSNALVTNFVSQWLELRSLQGISPNPERFPETVFDENLRDAFRRETELFVQSQLRDDQSLLDLLTANYTFVNERLARHYGIPNIYGSRFQRVTLTDDRRGGLLGQGSILALTSYADRTSPVLRGKWLLGNIFGMPPPPPPPNIPAFEDKADGKPVSARQAMERHRANPVCATCHVRMDPLGFALENFDAVGRWRAMGEDGRPIDASGSLPDGTHFTGVAGLRELAVSHKDDFVRTFAEKLLMYATGRGIEYYDMPAVRQILRESGHENYRWSSIILSVVKSVPFQMQRSDS